MSEGGLIFDVRYRYEVIEIRGDVSDLDPDGLLASGVEIFVERDSGKTLVHEGKRGKVIAKKLPGFSMIGKTPDGEEGE